MCRFFYVEHEFHVLCQVLLCLVCSVVAEYLRCKPEYAWQFAGIGAQLVVYPHRHHFGFYSAVWQVLNVGYRPSCGVLSPEQGPSDIGRRHVLSVAVSAEPCILPFLAAYIHGVAVVVFPCQQSRFVRHADYRLYFPVTGFLKFHVLCFPVVVTPEIHHALYVVAFVEERQFRV